jgi:hypothetical protein
MTGYKGAELFSSKKTKLKNLSEFFLETKTFINNVLPTSQIFFSKLEYPSKLVYSSLHLMLPQTSTT